MMAGKNQAALAVCAQTKVIFPFKGPPTDAWGQKRVHSRNVTLHIFSLLFASISSQITVCFFFHVYKMYEKNAIYITGA